MGYQERDYYRGDEGGRSVWSTLSLTAKLIILNVVLFLANLFFGGNNSDALTNALALSAGSIANPLYWYQFLTSGFVHDSANAMHLFGNMLGLWFFGKPLEERFGPREFLRFYLVAILAGSIIWAARQYFVVGPIVSTFEGAQVIDWPTLIGASGGVTACIILFCVLNPRATVMASLVFPIPAWLLGVIVVAGNLISMQGESLSRVAYDVHLVGAAFALAYWYFHWNFRWIPGLDGFGRFSGAKRWFKPRPALKVHDPEPEQEYEDLDTEADRILEKVHIHGETSLSARERKILEDYSRRLRQKLR